MPFDIPVPDKTMRVRQTCALLSALILFMPIARAADHSDTQAVIHNTSSPDTHEAVERHFEHELMKKHETVAKYYEEEARKSQGKAQELKVMLAHYEEKSYLYGKRAQDLQAHTEALIRKYEKTAKADAKEAVSHRQIALTLKEKNYPVSKIQKLSVSESYRSGGLSE